MRPFFSLAGKYFRLMIKPVTRKRRSPLRKCRLRYIISQSVRRKNLEDKKNAKE